VAARRLCRLGGWAGAPRYSPLRRWAGIRLRLPPRQGAVDSHGGAARGDLPGAAGVAASVVDSAAGGGGVGAGGECGCRELQEISVKMCRPIGLGTGKSMVALESARLTL